MPGIKLQNFLGRGPKVSSELLPNMAAQVATNVKLYSGDLIPAPQSISGTVDIAPSQGVETIYPLINPDDDSLVWMSWTTDVDIATPSAVSDPNEQRFYYTGDGVPKASTYELATGNNSPLTYPMPVSAGYYDLGLPLPTVVPTTTVTAFTSKDVSTIKRDSSGLVTLTTSTPHGLSAGSFVTISGFTYREGDYVQANNSSVIVVEIDGNTEIEASSQVVLRLTSNDGAITNGVFVVDLLIPANPPGNPYNGFSVNAPTTNTTGSSIQGKVQWDISSYNAISVEPTIINDTTIQYISPGFTSDVETINASFLPVGGTAPVLNISGDVQARTYLYTWWTPWEEESIGSEPSDAAFIREGQEVTVGNLPTVKPAGNNNVRAIRLYRSVATPTVSDYLRVATLWMPQTSSQVVIVRNASNPNAGFVGIYCDQPHELQVGDSVRVNVPGVTANNAASVLTNFEAEVLSIHQDAGGTSVAQSVFVYAYNGVANGPTADLPLTNASGTVYTGTKNYAGDICYYGFPPPSGNYTFDDDFPVEALLNTYNSGNFAAPPVLTDQYGGGPQYLKGLVAVNNNTLAGFINNQLYFSEPGQYHAWPSEYEKTIDREIVGISGFNGAIIVLTDSYPYIIQGNEPSNYVVSRVEARFPCVSKKSIVNMGYGVVFASNDGLAVYSTSTGPKLLTDSLYNSDTWNADLNPSTLVGVAYRNAYFASHSTGSITFEQDESVGGFFVDNSVSFSDARFDSTSNQLYYINKTSAQVLQWDNLSQPALSFTWKSKTYITPAPINLGAARVVADYVEWGTQEWNNASDKWNLTVQHWNSNEDLTFKLWVDKQLLFTRTLDSDEVFRLPAGYLSDTYEIGLEGDVRVRAVYLADTPQGLRSL